MPRRGVFAASADKHRYSWIGRLAEFAEMGARDYPPLIRRRLMIVNMTAYMIAIFSLFYAVLFAIYDIEAYLSLVIVNLVLVGVALLAPLTHRVSDVCAALIIATHTVTLLDEIISQFDFRAAHHGVEKIKTIAMATWRSRASPFRLPITKRGWR